MVPDGAADLSGVVGTYRRSLSVAGWTLVSRCTGLVRVVVIAAVLGPTFFGNLFQTTNQLPNITYELLAGSLFLSMLVPATVGYVDRDDRDGAARVAGGFLGIVFLICALAAACVLAVSTPLLQLMSLGIPSATVSDDYVTLGRVLVLVLIPQVFCYAVVGTAVAMQNASGRFSLAAAAPAVENLGIVVVLGVYASLFGTGSELADVGTRQLLVLGLGTTAAVALHALTQWWGALRAGVPLRPRAGWRDPEVRRLVKVAGPSIGYAGLNAIRLLGVLAAASTVAGGVVAFLLAMNFYNLAVALGARPVAQAMLPELSRHFDAGRRTEFRGTLVHGASLTFFVAVPSAVALVVLSGPLARAAGYGEMGDAAGIALLTAALAGLGAGTLGEAVFILFTHASYARRDAGGPVRVMALRTVLSLVGVTVAVIVLDSSPRLLFAIGLTVSVADLLAAALLGALVVRGAEWRQAARGPGFGPPLARASLAALLMAGPALATAVYGASLTGGRAPLVSLAAAVVAGLGVYVLTQRLRRSPELRSIVAVATRRRPQGASG